ncbi:RNA-binding protein [Entamoeba marina]
MALEHDSLTKNVLVTNLDPSVTVNTLTTFFSFTGNVVQVRLSDGPNDTKQAIIEFDNPESVKTAELMTGATLENKRIEIVATEQTHTSMHDEVFIGDDLPIRTIPEVSPEQTKTSVVASLIASGYVLADNTFQKAVQFDKEHGITNKIKQGANIVKDTLVEVDESLHLTEYLALGATVALSYAESINNKYQVTQTISEKAQIVDQSLGVTNAVGVARQKIGDGLNTVAASQPVQVVSDRVNNFKHEVEQDIAVKKNMNQLPDLSDQLAEEMDDEFVTQEVINEEQIDMPTDTRPNIIDLEEKDN